MNGIFFKITEVYIVLCLQNFEIIFRGFNWQLLPSSYSNRDLVTCLKQKLSQPSTPTNNKDDGLQTLDIGQEKVIPRKKGGKIGESPSTPMRVHKGSGPCNSCGMPG